MSHNNRVEGDRWTDNYYTHISALMNWSILTFPTIGNGFQWNRNSLFDC